MTSSVKIWLRPRTSLREDTSAIALAPLPQMMSFFSLGSRLS